MTLTGSGNTNGTGNELANILRGSTGNNILDGASGADVMAGYRGDDTYVVDEAGDVVAELAGNGTDTVRTSISYTLDDNFENLTLTGAVALAGIGNGLDNVLRGNTAGDLLNGGAGADTLAGYTGDDDLYGSSGNDILLGGVGNDALLGSSGDDQYRFNRGDGNDGIQDAIWVTTNAPADLDAAEGLNVKATGTVNTWVGGYMWQTSTNSLLKLTNGGTDTLVLGGGLAVEDLSFAWNGTTINITDGTSGDIVRLGLQTMGYARIEQLNVAGLGTMEFRVYSGTTLNGGAAAEYLFGLSGNEQINGGGGDDIIAGGAGADTMRGGAGNDTYFVDNAGDIVDESVAGSSGTDEVRSTVSFNLFSDPGHYEVENLRLLGAASIDGTGNNRANEITGNGAANTLLGYGGNDILDGGAGSDILYGGAGDDVFRVDEAGDAVNDSAGEGSDVVFASVHYTLTAGQHIEILETSSRAGTASINLVGNELNDRVIGNEGTNLLYGGGGNDTVIGMGGNDNLDGQAGDDRLMGGAGADKFVFRYSTLGTAGVDHILDFEAGDKIFVDHPTWAGPISAANFRLGANSLDADDRFLYDEPNNSLYLDVDGTGATEKVLIAIFDNGYRLTADEIEMF